MLYVQMLQLCCQQALCNYAPSKQVEVEEEVKEEEEELRKNKNKWQ